MHALYMKKVNDQMSTKKLKQTKNKPKWRKLYKKSLYIKFYTKNEN